METLRSDRQRLKEPIRQESHTPPQTALLQPKCGQGRLFYPTFAVVILLIILTSGGVLYLLRSNESQAANQALDAAQQQLMDVRSKSPSTALKTLATTQKALTAVQNKLSAQ